MSKTVNLKKCLRFKIELAVLACIVCVWAVKLITVDIDSTRATLPVQIVKQRPNDAEAQPKFDDVYYDLNRLKEAIASHEQVINVAPKLKTLNEKSAKGLSDISTTVRDTATYDTSIEQQQFVNINEYATQQRQRVEKRYTQSLAILDKWAKNILEQLEGEEKAAWGRYLQNMNNIVSIESGYAYSNDHFSGTAYSFVVGDPAGQYSQERRLIQNAKAAVELEFKKLRQRRDDYLAEIERYTDAEERRLAEIERYKDAEKRRAQKHTEIKLAGGPGLVGAVSISGENKLIMIEGRVLREGDSINGFKVSGIYPDRIEFEKSGKAWVHKME